MKYFLPPREFLKDDSGNIALIFAFVITVLLTCTGMAIDYARIVNTRMRMQGALDATVLAAARENIFDNAAGRSKAHAQQLFEANSKTGEIRSWEVAHAGAIGNVSAIAQLSQPNMFLGIIGRKEEQIVVRAAAEAKMRPAIQQFRFSPGPAKGWFNKTVTLFGVFEEDGKDVSKPLWSMHYQYQPYSITSTSSGWISVENAKSAYLKMDVDPNSRGFSQYSIYQENRTDNPDLIGYIRKGTEPLAKPINMLTDINCAEKEDFGWEDGGDGDYIDFTFSLEGQCEIQASAVEYVRLVE